MAIGFKRPTEAIFLVPTDAEDLTLTGSGSHNAEGNVAFDKFAGEGTGYSNFFTEYPVSVQFTPGVAKRYDLLLQGYRYLGECSIKVDTRYEDLVDRADHLQIGSVKWNFSRLTERGVGFGNDRIVLVLNRKTDA